MHFKALELLGFKSFAEKTKLNFEPGVTAVVGPNGCGKSNIADSIRWVLGEQSAKSLRASNMQDVIFNGTDTKEPINFAEVSLTFSNEKRVLPIDYDEVTITRRVFRSGETEYLLNKTPVRLKDISELLMGTGIGTESYSIIEQGKMDLILSSKPEDRRFVFEEASGITKYKSKKKEALRKLEQTEQNLLRINDIIQEVKRQISSIERQARKAERYKADFDGLKDLEVRLSFCEYKNLKTREATYSVENADAKAREKELDLETKSIVSKISGYRQSLDELTHKIGDLRAKNSETSNTFDMNVQKIGIDKERIEEARILQEGLNKEIALAGDKIQNAKALLGKLESELAKAASVRMAKQKSVEEKEFLLNDIAKYIEDTESKVKVCKVQTVDHLAKETRIKNELIKIGADVQNRRSRQRRLEAEKDKVHKELEAVEERLLAVSGEFESLEKKVLSIREDLDRKSSTRQDVISAIRTLDLEIAKEENRKTAVRSKVEILEEHLKRHEGFKSGVKNLLARLSESTELPVRISGVLAEMIKVERGYEEAVSALLGDDAETLIVQTDKDAQEAIEYLRKNGLGKASFISLETLRKTDAVRAREEAPPSYGTPLKNFVRIEAGYEAVREHFFARAYLVETLDDIFKNAGSLQSARLVTKLGCTACNYKISGGSAADAAESLLIGRRDRLEDFKTQIKELDVKLLSLASECAQKTDVAKLLEGETNLLADALRKEETSLLDVKMRRDGQVESAAKLKEEKELLESELEETAQTINELTKNGEVLNIELNEIEKEKSAAQAFVEESVLLIANKRDEREKTALEIATFKTEALSLEKEEEGIRNSLKSQEAFVFEIEDTLYSKEALLKESLDKMKSMEEEMVRLDAANQTIKIDLKALNDEMSTFEKARLEASNRLAVDEAQLKEKEHGLEVLRNQVRDLDVKLTEINYKKTSLRERISQAYKSDLETLHMEVDENTDWDALRSQVTELKDKLEKMGPVNLVAIDEHKELEERHSFLVHQEGDLVSAKDSVLKAIQKINKTTKELFIDAFGKIQVEFKNFFRLLFGGGQAELILIDEQDVLESGIEIVVRPPGKKLQNIMLLSGGEKAMTAIALLFAIFKVKPSPFCVLDEIDAPLDESNVLRFSNVLKDFLKISQFIIITHNKRTIELADVMYGITMQERGVSKIISVKFMDKKTVDVEQEKEKRPEEKTDTASASVAS